MPPWVDLQRHHKDHLLADLHGGRVSANKNVLHKLILSTKKEIRSDFQNRNLSFESLCDCCKTQALQLVTVPQLCIVGCVALSGAHPPHCCPRWVLQVERLLAEEIRGLGVAAVPAVIKIDLNR